MNYRTDARLGHFRTAPRTVLGWFSMMLGLTGCIALILSLLYL